MTENVSTRMWIRSLVNGRALSSVGPVGSTRVASAGVQYEIDRAADRNDSIAAPSPPIVNPGIKSAAAT